MGQKLGGAVPLLDGAGSPSNTVAWAEAYLHTKWHLNPSSHCLATTEMGRKLGPVSPFWGMGAGSPSSTVAWAEAYLYTKLHLDPSILATIDMG